jgi:hypothetical protein
MAVTLSGESQTPRDRRDGLEAFCAADPSLTPASEVLGIADYALT